VGIPRGLACYYLYPFLDGFLRSLGAEVVLSSPADARLLASLDCCPTDECCVSAKIFYAQAKNLLAAGVDFLFIPVLSSVEKENYCCPKLTGAAYMVAGGLAVGPERLLAPEINEREKPGRWREEFFSAGERLGARPKEIRRAIREAEEQQKKFLELTRQESLTLPEAFARLNKAFSARRRVFDPAARRDPSQVIGVMGHPYILYDYVGHDVVFRLREYGRVVTPEMVPLEEAAGELAAAIYEGEKMWAYEGRLLGAALYLLRRRLVNKMVFVEAFSCGPASVIEPYLEEEAERQGVPFLLLTVDEHTGVAGLLTRLEAFVDTASFGRGEPFLPVGEKEGKDPGPGAGAFSPPVPGERPAGAKVGAPSVSWSGKALAAVLEECGVDVVPAPPVTAKTVELGKELAPEFICYPMVTTLGQIRELLAAGADVIAMVGGKGRCRLGWYAQIQELLLRSKGYDFELVIIDSPTPLRENWERFNRAVKRIAGGASWPKIARAFWAAYQKMKLLEEAEGLVRRKQAREQERGAARRLLEQFRRRIFTAGGPREAGRLARAFREELRHLPEIAERPLKVRISGEFYAVLEDFVNHSLEEFLASRPGVRVEIDREMTAGGWFDLHVLRKKSAVRRYRQKIQAAKPFLPVPVGGHGQESVGEFVLARQEGVDGVIHLFPFTCMPEIIAQGILVPLAERLEMPFLSLAVNEQTGTAGLQTRLEAFLDVLQARREEKIHVFGGDACGLLSGY
jgi:predicted nucleotide-binding protein (sugar kinase/HSP70/actin superfamily)